MPKSNISAYLVVYNEGEKIEACLKSLRDVVNEIIVVHDGPCTDDTLMICAKYECKIFTRERLGNAEPHRPFAIAQSNYDWVLQIDADERLSEGLRSALGELTNDPEVDAYTFRWVTDINGTKSNWLVKRILFRKSKMYAVGFPHIQAETRGSEKDLSLELLHDTKEYNSPTQLLKKYLRKDKEWGRVSASILNGPLSAIPTYNCVFPSKDTKESGRLLLIKHHPLLSILSIPLYGLLYGYIIKGSFTHGYVGFVLSCHTPLHSFYTCLFLLKRKFPWL
ncbi:MAG: glycosyltransferase [bacterium]